MLNLSAYVKVLSRLPIVDLSSQQLVPFVLNVNQARAIAQLEEHYRKTKLLRWICVKSRRVGMSALTDGLLLVQRLQFPNTEARIVAHLDDSVEQLFKVPLTLVSGLQNEFPNQFPQPTKDKITIPHPIGASYLTIGTARTTAGGRGGGFQSSHFSEAAYYPSGATFTSLLSAVPDHEDTLVSIESTANGKIGQGESFYRFWQAAVKGENEYCPIFLSWINDPMCQRPESEAANAPHDEHERELVRFFGLSKAQLAWRRYILKNKCQSDINIFLQEFPHTWEVAFIASGHPAFTSEEMLLARQSLADPIFKGYIERKEDKSIAFTASTVGSLCIWKRPLENHWYYAGVDAARGQESGDFAAIVIIDGTTNEVVARMAEKINPRALAKVANDLGRYYNKALLCIELTGNLGGECQRELRDYYHYPNFYKRKGKDDKLQLRQPSSTLGWETNHRSREMMLVAFRESIREGELQVRDEQLLNQMEEAQRPQVGEHWELRKGHDDIIIGAMLANIAVRHYPPPKSLGFRRPTDDPQEQAKVLDFKVSGGTVAEAATVAAQRNRARVEAHTRRTRHLTPLDRLHGV